MEHSERHTKVADRWVKRKGQVTIPSNIRRGLGLEEGATLEVREEERGILLVARRTFTATTELRG
ncbi:MAG: AbrB/MazE/SpoVT family DNA-binding domain-containing protein [Nitrososphaerota archaeon]|nr:AbrB/MazE/SpoVT family DNA-binding domain-containing protein [Nitrososphaerota archaeon]